MALPHRRILQIASIPGDGIGTEISTAAHTVLEKLASSIGTFSFEFEIYDWSSENYERRGYYMPKDGLEQLKRSDAIFFGAVGWPTVPDHISLWGLILPIRKHMNQYANVRPTRVFSGTAPPLKSSSDDPTKLDWIIVRENSEGEYAGQGGTSHENSPFTTATEVSIFTRPAIERIFRFAFSVAARRPRKHLTLVTKSNAQRHGMVLWDTIFSEIQKESEGLSVTTDKVLVDAATVRMVNNPASLDTIVATNLHADILSDLAAALSGSIGIAPSSNLDPTRQYPSMFEPIHGSAPDIAGKGVANPVGAFWSAAEMVRWLAGKGEVTDAAGLPNQHSARVKEMNNAADALMKAVEKVTASGIRTRDLGGSSDTKQVTESVCLEIERMFGKVH